MKTCPICNQSKSLEDFYIRTIDNKPYARCKSCWTVRERDRYHHKGGKDRQRWNQVKVQFGITKEQYDFIVKIQNGKCPLCFRAWHSQFNIDHDHSHHENKEKGCYLCVRGVLCKPCNHRFLPWVEKFPQLQSEFVKRYLAGRPLEKAPADATKETNEQEHEKS